MKALKIINSIITDQNGVLMASEDAEGIKTEYNLVDELRKYINIDGLNLKLTKARKASGASRAKNYKFACPKCGKKISSHEENLVAECVECNENFEKVE